MNFEVLVEVFGYVASLTVAVSLMLRSFIKLRILNMIGATLLVVYCVITKAYPLLFLNGFIAIVNLFYILQYYNKKEFFRFYESKPDAAFLREFLQFYKYDIIKYFPDFESKFSDDAQCFYLLRNMVPACVFIVKRDANNSAEIILDYVTKEYRDTKIGKFIFDENAKYFVNMGINRFYFEKPDKKHVVYLNKVGFVKKDESTGLYEKELSKIW